MKKNTQHFDLGKLRCPASIKAKFKFQEKYSFHQLIK
jgi:hypothetical protein